LKSLTALAFAAGIALAMLPLRAWTELDVLWAPVNRWLWLRSEIVLSPPRRIDWAFTGSSMTQSAIRPERIAARHPGTVAYNFAHFSWGHDADYWIAEALLERHDVGTLVVEIPRVAPREPHGETVNLVNASALPGELRIAAAEVSARDVLRYDPAFKRRLARVCRYAGSALFSFPRHLLERLAAAVAGRSLEYAGSWADWEGHAGFAPPLEDREPPAGFRERQRADPPPLPVRPARPFVAGAPEPQPGPRDELYLGRLRALADAHGTRLVFLHVPRWRKRLPSVEQHRFYSRFGEVILADLKRLQEPEHYADPLHLQGEGTNVFTDDVARLLVEGTEGSPFNRLYREARDREAGDR